MHFQLRPAIETIQKGNRVSRLGEEKEALDRRHSTERHRQIQPIRRSKDPNRKHTSSFRRHEWKQLETASHLRRLSIDGLYLYHRTKQRCVSYKTCSPSPKVAACCKCIKHSKRKERKIIYAWNMKPTNWSSGSELPKVHNCDSLRDTVESRWKPVVVFERRWFLWLFLWLGLRGQRVSLSRPIRFA